MEIQVGFAVVPFANCLAAAGVTLFAVPDWKLFVRLVGLAFVSFDLVVDFAIAKLDLAVDLAYAESDLAAVLANDSYSAAALAAAKFFGGLHTSFEESTVATAAELGDSYLISKNE